MGDNNLTNVIYDATRKQYGIIVPHNELVKALKEKIHRDLTDKISDQFIERFVVVKYSKPVESNRVSELSGLREWHYDILMKDYAQGLRLTKEKLKKVLDEETDTIKLLKEGYEKEQKKQEVEAAYKKNNTKMLEDAIKLNSVAQ